MLQTDSDIVCINLVIRIWSAQKRLKPEDLGLKQSQMIPHELGSLGSKKVHDPDRLKKFLTLRRKAERICKNYGVQFLGGYAVGKDKASKVAEMLKEVRDEFLAEKKVFIEGYQANSQLWIDSLPEKWREKVKEAVESPAVVEKAISFDFQAFNVAKIEGLSKGLEEEFDSLGAKLINDIKTSAIRIYEQSFKDKDKVSQKALRPIQVLQEKVRSLEFLDENATRCAAALQEALDKMPKRGFIEGFDRAVIVGALETLERVGKQVVVDETPEEPEDVMQVCEPHKPNTHWF